MRLPVTQEITGSNPVRVANLFVDRSSSDQDPALSRRQRGFESRTVYQLFENTDSRAIRRSFGSRDAHDNSARTPDCVGMVRFRVRESVFSVVAFSFSGLKVFTDARMPVTHEEGDRYPLRPPFSYTGSSIGRAAASKSAG